MKKVSASTSKKKPSHDPSTGQFESRTPMNDPAMAQKAVRWVRAIDELAPLFEKGSWDGSLEAHYAGGMDGVGLVLKTLKQSLLEGLSVAEDKDFYKAARKPVLRAAHYVHVGPTSPDECVAMQATAQDSLLLKGEADHL